MTDDPMILSNDELAEAITTTHELYYRTYSASDDRREPLAAHYRALLREQERRAVTRSSHD